MDIFLSVNNREDVLQIPIMPASFTITKPQTTEKFETVSGSEIMLIGEPKLKGISWESFFPTKEQPNIHHSYNSDMWGWDYVYKIDTWISEKLPIRLIITYEHKDTPINIAVAVTDFEYEMKTDGDLWYKISFEEFNLLGHETIVPWYDEEEIDLEELEALKTRVAQLEELVNDMAKPHEYNYVDENMPEWARDAVTAAVNRKCVGGTGDGLDLDYQDLRHITMLYRAGVFGMIYNYNDDNIPSWAKDALTAAMEKGCIKGNEEDKLNLTETDLRLLTIMYRAGVFD